MNGVCPRLGVAAMATAAILLFVPGCGDADAATQRAPAPPLPPLMLRPMLGELQAIVAARPLPELPAQKELQQYAEVALQQVEADPRTQARCEQSLLENRFAWWVLEPALQHDDVAVRRRAAWLCGQSGQTVLQLPLLLRLKYEMDPETVVWIADALQRLGNDLAFSWLDGAMDRAETADQAGRLAIAALTDRGIELPTQPTWDDIKKPLRELQRKWRRDGTPTRSGLPAPDAAELDARLAGHLMTPQGTQLRPVDDARYVLRQSGVLAVPMLARAVVAEEHYLRTMPLQVLAELGTAAKSAEPAVLPLLGDAFACAYAARALGEMQAESALPYLRWLCDDIDTDLRTEAVRALGMIGGDGTQTLLEARLRDAGESLDVRVGAAFGLLCLGAHAEAEAFLTAREQARDFHGPELQILRERIRRHRER